MRLSDEKKKWSRHHGSLSTRKLLHTRVKKNPFSTPTFFRKQNGTAFELRVRSDLSQVRMRLKKTMQVHGQRKKSGKKWSVEGGNDFWLIHCSLQELTWLGFFTSAFLLVRFHSVAEWLVPVTRSLNKRRLMRCSSWNCCSSRRPRSPVNSPIQLTRTVSVGPSIGCTVQRHCDQLPIIDKYIFISKRRIKAKLINEYLNP